MAGRLIKEYEADKADIIEECGNGEIIFKRDTTMTTEILKWVLSFGSQVEVLEPNELKQEIIADAREMINNYADSNSSNDR